MMGGRQDRWGVDEPSNWPYRVSVTPSYDYSLPCDGESEFEVHYVHIEVCYEFLVYSGVDAPIAETSASSNSGLWCIEELPGGEQLSGLKQEVLLLLDRAGVPSAARDDTMGLIFPGIVPPQVYRPTVKSVVGVFLKTDTAVLYDFDAEEEMHEDINDEDIVFSLEVEEEEMFEGDQDEEFGRVLGESMYEDSLRARPARKEAVEGLEKVRVWGRERETACVVCLEEFSLGMEVTKMECSHMFHQDCLGRWLESRCFCPLCKFELPAAEEAYEDSS